MPSLTEPNLSFFSSIVEVNGYVKVTGDLYTGNTELPFSNLRAIRGELLTKYSDKYEDEFSLIIHNVNQITSLGLRKLRGNALIKIIFLLFDHFLF